MTLKEKKTTLKGKINKVRTNISEQLRKNTADGILVRV